MAEGAEGDLRRPYKRTPHGIVASLRRPYKRGRPPADFLVHTPALPPPPPPPAWMTAAIMSGQVRCPRKWSDLAIAICAQIQQDTPDGCAAERCCYRDKAAVFLAEIQKAKSTGIAPKAGPRGKLALVPDNEDDAA